MTQMREQIAVLESQIWTVVDVDNDLQGGKV